MQNINLTEFDEVKYPNRKPWLWLLIVALLMVGLGVRYLRPKPSPADTRAPAAAAEAVAPAPAAAPASAAAPGPAAAAAPAPQASSPPRQKPAADSALLLPVLSTGAVSKIVYDALTFEKQGELVKARDLYRRLLHSGIDDKTREAAETGVGRINIELVNTPRAMPEKVDYVVERNDSLARIAKKHGTTASLVQKSNQITNPDRIRSGDRLRVFNGKFSVHVSKTRNDMVVMMNGEFFKRYRVGTGKFGKTPVGTFTVVDRIVQPTWWRPDGREVPFGEPENILGTRWLALRATGQTADVRGYGIHGTWDDSSIGKAESAGCIRMRNSEVEELFDLLPLDTPVTIEE